MLCVMHTRLAAQVLPLPDELLLQHAVLYDEFKNASHWPKHVLVHYHFHSEGEINFSQGLYVLMAMGACWRRAGRRGASAVLHRGGGEGGWGGGRRRTCVGMCTWALSSCCTRTHCRAAAAAAAAAACTPQA
jgi:hypothetical protein